MSHKNQTRRSNLKSSIDKKVLRTSLATWSIATKSSLDKFHQRKFKQKQINITVMQSKKISEQWREEEKPDDFIPNDLNGTRIFAKSSARLNSNVQYEFHIRNHSYRARQFMTIKIKKSRSFSSDLGTHQIQCWKKSNACRSQSLSVFLHIMCVISNFLINDFNGCRVQVNNISSQIRLSQKHQNTAKQMCPFCNTSSDFFSEILNTIKLCVWAYSTGKKYTLHHYEWILHHHSDAFLFTCFCAFRGNCQWLKSQSQGVNCLCGTSKQFNLTSIQISE